MMSNPEAQDEQSDAVQSGEKTPKKSLFRRRNLPQERDDRITRLAQWMRTVRKPRAEMVRYLVTMQHLAFRLFDAEGDAAGESCRYLAFGGCSFVESKTAWDVSDIEISVLDESFPTFIVRDSAAGFMVESRAVWLETEKWWLVDGGEFHTQLTEEALKKDAELRAIKAAQRAAVRAEKGLPPIVPKPDIPQSTPAHDMYSLLHSEMQHRPVDFDSRQHPALEVDAFVKAWCAQFEAVKTELWTYREDERQLDFRVQSVGSDENLHIVCCGCDSFKLSAYHEPGDLVVRLLPGASPRYSLVNLKTDGFVECEFFRITKNVLPLHRWKVSEASLINRGEATPNS